jgi:hypothetical protein
MSLEDDIESQLVRDKKILERGKSLQRLLNSSDFKSVIVNGFLREYALHLVYQRANSTEDGDITSRKIDAVAEFKAYLDKILDEATTAQKSVDEAADELVKIRNHED